MLRSSGAVAREVSAGLDTVAVRSPDHPVALALLSACGVPVAAPSANISGGPSPTEAKHVCEDLNGRIDALLDGGRCRVGLESTVLDLASGIPRILRPGGITLERIGRSAKTLSMMKRYSAKSLPICRCIPGMKYRHYAPRAMSLSFGRQRKVAEYIHGRALHNPNIAVLCYDEELPLYDGLNAVSYGPRSRHDILSYNLYSALRTLDETDANTIFARCPEGGGTAVAVENRLMRASAHHIVDVK